MTTQHPEEVRRQFEALWASVDRMIVDAWKLGGCEKSLDMLAMRARFDEATNQAAIRSPAVAGLVEALQTVAGWKLPETGETWPSGNPMSYEACYGSDGARTFMRNVSRAALAQYATLAGEGHE